MRHFSPAFPIFCFSLSLGRSERGKVTKASRPNRGKKGSIALLPSLFIVKKRKRRIKTPFNFGMATSAVYFGHPVEELKTPFFFPPPSPHCQQFRRERVLSPKNSVKKKGRRGGLETREKREKGQRADTRRLLSPLLSPPFFRPSVFRTLSSPLLCSSLLLRLRKAEEVDTLPSSLLPPPLEGD